MVNLFERLRFSYPHFLRGRVRRLWPSVLATIAGTAILVYCMAPSLLPKVRGDALPSALFYSNWSFIFRKLSYFQATTIRGITPPQILVWVGLRHSAAARRVATASASLRSHWDCHLVLRGSSSGPNYDPVSVARALDDLKASKVAGPSDHGLIIDAAHGNCGKDEVVEVQV